MPEYRIASSARATQTNVLSSATSVALVAANQLRKQLIFGNASTAILYILLGDAAGTAATATTAHTIQIPTLGNVVIRDYTGPVSGIWASANGSVNITELT